jgi:hypothetical protein
MGSLLESILSKYGDSVIKTAIAKLIQLGKVASGRLKKSLGYKIVKTSDSYQIRFEGADYMDEVENGRKPGKMPSVGKIQQWMQYKGLPEKDNKSVAFLIARSIGRNGIEPTQFFRKSIIENNDKFRKTMTKDLSDYIIRDIKKIIQK